MDLDPRDNDPRDDDPRETGREREEECYQPGRRGDLGDGRDRDDDTGLHIGRGSTSHEKSESDPRERDEERWPDRERGHAPRDVFTRDLDLPRGREREIVRDRDREYTLRGSESRTLATVGAFRVVSSRDLRDHHDRPADPRSGNLRHLREQGLVETARVPGSRDHAVALTKEGRHVLESHSDRHGKAGQAFYAGVKRERELEHDVQVYRAFEREAERLEQRGARIDRVVLDYELKREYQTWLHERDHDRDSYDGHPDRDGREIEEWAHEHDLPYFDDQVHFPDLRIEYEDIDGRPDHRDVEVLTINYRGAHGAAAARSGFSCYRGSSARIGGRGGRRAGEWRSRRTRRGAAGLNSDDRVKAVAEFGFTERQARFLVTVMLHSGLCVPRQYASFAGTAYGHKVSKFFDKLLGLATGADAQTQSPAVPGALLNHLQLQVSNLEASCDFYTKLFGSTQRPSNGDPNRLALMVAGASLVLSKTTGRSGIGHYGVGVEPFDAKKTEAAIKRALPNSDAQASDTGDNVGLHDPDSILVQITSKSLYQG